MAAASLLIVKNAVGSAHTVGANAEHTGKRTRANAAGPLCDEVVVVGPRGFKGQTQLGQKKPHTGQQAPNRIFTYSNREPGWF